MAGLSLLLSLIGSAHAADAVLVLTDASEAHTVRLANELRLAGVHVQVLPVPPTFGSQPLREQLDVVQGGLHEERAAVWLSRGDDGALDASIAFLSEGRAVVRLVRAPSDAQDPVATLALLTREILSATEPPQGEVVSLPAASVRAESGDADSMLWTVHGVVGVDGPTSGLGAGPWLGGDAELTVGGPQVRLGAGAGLRLARDGGRRGVFRLTGRAGPGLVGVGVDVTRVQWAMRTQPKIEVGVTSELPYGGLAEFRLRFLPVRDVIERGDERLYDSGRVEIGVYLGAARQIARSPRQGWP